MSSSIHPPGPENSQDSNRNFSKSATAPKKILGATKRQWLEYLVAILLGNTIYYLSLQPHLPEVFQHKGFMTDWGLLVDFAVCVGVYGLIRLGFKVTAGK
jgi:hypothetical protein